MLPGTETCGSLKRQNRTALNVPCKRQHSFVSHIKTLALLGTGCQDSCLSRSAHDHVSKVDAPSPPRFIAREKELHRHGPSHHSSNKWQRNEPVYIPGTPNASTSQPKSPPVSPSRVGHRDQRASGSLCPRKKSASLRPHRLRRPLRPSCRNHLPSPASCDDGDHLQHDTDGPKVKHTRQ